MRLPGRTRARDAAAKDGSARAGEAGGSEVRRVVPIHDLCPRVIAIALSLLNNIRTTDPAGVKRTFDMERG